MLIELFLAIFCFYILGLSTRMLLFNQRKIDLMDLSEVFGLGFALAGFLLLLTSLLLIKFSWSLLLVLSLLIFLFSFFYKKPDIEKINVKSLKLFDWFLIILICAYLISIFLKTFSYPIWGCDAYTLWLARARAFWTDRIITLDSLKRFWPAEHPPLWSLTIAWVYIFLQQPNELIIRFLPFLFYLLIIFSFLKHVRIHNSLKFVFIFFLLTLPQLVDNVIDPHLAGNADLFLALYFLLGIISIYKKDFSKAGLFFALSGWVKNDGTPSVLFFIFLILFFNIKKKLKPITFAFLPAFFLFGAKYLLGISSRYFKSFYNPSYLAAIWYDLMAFREEMRKISNWNLLWWLFLFILVLNRKKIIKNRSLFFSYLMVICQIVSYFLIFLITPENQAGHIASAIYRLLLHVAPAALFLTASCLW